MAKEWTAAERQAMSEKMKAKHAAQQAPAETVSAPAPVAEEEPAVMPMVEHEDEPLPEEIAEPQPMTAFEVYLSSLPDEARELLTEAELRAAFDDAEREAKAERRKQLQQTARDKAKSQARATSGLLTPEKVEALALAEKMNKRVRVTIQLPLVGDTGGVAAEGVTLDGVTYYHGQSYTMPMGRALTIRDILYRGQQVELDFMGLGRLNGLRRQHASNVNVARV